MPRPCVYERDQGRTHVYTHVQPHVCAGTRLPRGQLVDCSPCDDLAFALLLAGDQATGAVGDVNPYEFITFEKRLGAVTADFPDL